VPGFVSPYASAVTGNRVRPFSIRPLPNRTYKLSKYPALRWAYLTVSVGLRAGRPAWIPTWHAILNDEQRRLGVPHVAYLHELPSGPPVPLRRVCPAFPDADYDGDSVAVGLAPGRRSRVFRPSYVRAWVRPSTHPYARDHLPVSHPPGLPGAKDEHPSGGDAALSQPSGGAALVPIGIRLEAV
jgi:hypothetical protein